MSGAGERGASGVTAPPDGEAVHVDHPSVALARQAAELLDPQLDELRADVREVRGSLDKNTWRLLYVFGSGFLALGGLLIGGYFRLSNTIATDLDRAASQLEARLDRQEVAQDKEADQIQKINQALARIEQKLDDLTRPPSPLPRR